jgi:transposase-like protein
MFAKRPSSPFDRPRWTEQDARAALAALDRSGLSVRQFAAEQGLDPQRLWLWRRRVAGGDRTTFQELIVRPSSAESAIDGDADRFEVVFGSGVVVRVPPSFDSASLVRLVEALRQARAC